MQQDIRARSLYREVEAFHQSVRQPGTGQISDAGEVCVSPDGNKALFSATIVDELEGTPPTRIGEVCLISGTTRILSSGPHTDRLPRYSPDGRRIAFLSDRHRAGDFQLYLLDPSDGQVKSTQCVDGWVEYIQWSADGRRILLGVAGHGADTSGGQGAVASTQLRKELPVWTPSVETGTEADRWRRVWVYELDGERAQVISAPGTNIWEAAWCGSESIAAIASTGAEEGSWYAARLLLIDTRTGRGRQLHTPRDQLGVPAGSPGGACLAFVEAICSDRGLVAGDLRLIDLTSGAVDSVDTHGIDVTCVEWRSEQLLLVAGHRGFDTAIGYFDLATRTFTEVWSSSEISTGGTYVTVSGIGAHGDCALVGEGFMTAPQIAVIRNGRYHPVRSFDLGYEEQAKAIAAVERVSWKAPDGLAIQGWLLLPQARPPHPTVMSLHGGPVWHWRPTCLRGGTLLMLIRTGYAVFLPNPRGSAGCGQEFARKVVRDMGGADAQDCLSGLDYLVEKGIVDSRKLGVTGGSYGGFMSAWLITQTSRFSAAIPVCPITNFVSSELTSHIPEFYRLFLGGSFRDCAAQHLKRSPVTHAPNVKTPTLIICGALDRGTPPEQAVQLHHALVGCGVKSMLVTYPHEGHGIRKLPAVIDYVVRVLSWFQEHMPTITKRESSPGGEGE